MTAPTRSDVHAVDGRDTRTHRPRRSRPAEHIAPEPSWTALGRYLATR